MKKQKKNLLILGGVIAGVIVVALGAFALNPQGGLYKGMVATSDIKLISDDSKLLSLPADEGDDLVMSPAPPGSEEEKDSTEPAPTLIKFVEETKFVDEGIGEIAEKTLDIPIPSTPPDWPSLVPMISGYNPTGTPYLNPQYGPEAIVLYFDVDAHGSEYKQEDNIYLHHFYVDYLGCVGDTNDRPETVPQLRLRDGLVISTDLNKNGIFERTEFNTPGTEGMPLYFDNNRQFMITMPVDSTMCTAGSLAQVIVRDILWTNEKGELFHYDDDIPNNLEGGSPDAFTVFYNTAIL